jgi:TMEM175 potassium channel family protein
VFSLARRRLSEEKETGRLEAFSDGIFAFAMTLLVLGLRDPVTSGGNLLSGLVNEWPAFFAFFTSFFSVLVMWVNHHNMFTYIRRISTSFMFLNGFLMLTVTLTPFTTMLIADHITLGDASTAAEVYSGVFLLLGVIWNLCWRHASKGNRLLSSTLDENAFKNVNRDYNFGTLLYAVAFGLAFVNGLASVVLVLLLAGFWAFSASTRSLHPKDVAGQQRLVSGELASFVGNSLL